MSGGSAPGNISHIQQRFVLSDMFLGGPVYGIYGGRAPNTVSVSEGFFQFAY